MRRMITAIAASAVLLIATACGGSDEPEVNEDGLRPATLGVLPIVDVAPAYLGIEQGYFEDEGIALTIETVQGGPTGIASVVNGDLDFGYSAVTSLLLANNAGLNMKIISAGDYSTGVDGADFGGIVAGPNSGITDVADLAGKKVAVNTLGNIAEATLQVSLEEAGIELADLQFVELQFADMPAALSSGNVDAAWVVEPFLSITQLQGATLVDSNMVSAGGDDNLLVGAYFASAQLSAEDSDLVEGFARAMEKSLAYAAENPDEVRRILLTYTELDESLASSILLPKFPTEKITTEDVQLIADLSAGAGIIPDDFDPSSLLD